MRVFVETSKEIPDIHIHGFSPEEILYGAQDQVCLLKSF